MVAAVVVVAVEVAVAVAVAVGPPRLIARLKSTRAHPPPLAWADAELARYTERWPRGAQAISARIHPLSAVGVGYVREPRSAFLLFFCCFSGGALHALLGPLSRARKSVSILSLANGSWLYVSASHSFAADGVHPEQSVYSRATGERAGRLALPLSAARRILCQEAKAAGAVRHEHRLSRVAVAPVLSWCDNPARRKPQRDFNSRRCFFPSPCASCGPTNQPINEPNQLLYQQLACLLMIWLGWVCCGLFPV